MKKNLLYLFNVLCMLSFFTACSDDEDVNVLEGVNTSFKGETLDLKYSGSPFLGKEVVFDTKDGQTATITMRGTLDMSALGGLLGGGSRSDYYVKQRGFDTGRRNLYVRRNKRSQRAYSEIYR